MKIYIANILNRWFKYFYPLLFLLISNAIANNLIIVIIDGARYSETFGAKDTYIPFMWNEMRPQGTIFTNFYNDGTTKTNPGHATIVTGNWQNIANNGTERPTLPTIFEYYRQQTGAADSSTYIVAGADKLSAISYSTYAGYGADYGSLSITNNYTGDLITYNNLITVMETKHPSLILVNFKQVDKMGHSGNWSNYLSAISQVDSLIYQLWLKINKDSYYKGNTTLFITNDHGRHDDEHGGFVNHGDGCEGCRHIMCLTIGNNIEQNLIVIEKRTQIDLAPTAADVLSFSSIYAQGYSFRDLISTQIDYTYLYSEGTFGSNVLTWKISTQTDLTGFIIKRSYEKDGQYDIISSYESDSNLIYNYGLSINSVYTFTDYDVSYGENYWYKIIATDSSRIQKESEPLFATPNNNENTYSIIDDNFYQNTYKLKQNYPNPFNPSTTISFSIPNTEYVTLDIFNMLGQKMETIIEQHLNPGNYHIKWTANNLAEGIYFYRLKAGNFMMIKSMILIK